MTRRLLPFLLLPLAVHAAEERLRYRCDNGSRLDMSFQTNADERPQATLHFADETIILPRVPAASGELYRNEAVRLHTRGDDALLEDGRGNALRCTRGEQPPAIVTPPTASPSSFLDVSGSVSYRVRMALPPDAVLIVRIQDVARADAPARTLAEQRIDLAGQQVPIPFETTVDRDLIGKRARIVVTARIEHRGKLLFISDRSTPILGHGQGNHADLQLKPVAARPGR